MKCNCNDMQALNSPRWTCPLHGVISRTNAATSSQLDAFNQTIEICERIVQKHVENCEDSEASGANECLSALKERREQLQNK